MGYCITNTSVTDIPVGNRWDGGEDADKHEMWGTASRILRERRKKGGKKRDDKGEDEGR